MKRLLIIVLLFYVSSCNEKISSVPLVSADRDEIIIKAISGSYGVYGIGSIHLVSNEVIDRDDFVINKVHISSEASKIKEIDYDREGNITNIYLYYESDSLWNEKFEFILTLDGYELKIPIFIVSVR